MASIHTFWFYSHVTCFIWGRRYKSCDVACPTFKSSKINLYIRRRVPCVINDTFFYENSLSCIACPRGTNTPRLSKRLLYLQNLLILSDLLVRGMLTKTKAGAASTFYVCPEIIHEIRYCFELYPDACICLYFAVVWVLFGF